MFNNALVLPSPIFGFVSEWWLSADLRQWGHATTHRAGDPGGLRPPVRHERRRYVRRLAFGRRHADKQQTAPFYFTQLLMPALLAGRVTSPDHHARVITTSSAGAYVGKLQWDTFKDGPVRRKQSPVDLYAQSKLVRAIDHRHWALDDHSRGLL